MWTKCLKQIKTQVIHDLPEHTANRMKIDGMNEWNKKKTELIPKLYKNMLFIW